MFDRMRRNVMQKILVPAGCVPAVLLLALAAAGCGGGETASVSATPAVSGTTGSSVTGDVSPAPKLSVIEFGSHNANPAKRDTLVRAATAGEARALQRRLFAGSIDSHPWPAVDYSKNEIIAVLLASGGGGESVKIDTIERKDESATVHATHVVPGENCVVAAVVTAPFAVVEAPRLPATVRLDIKTVRRDC